MTTIIMIQNADQRNKVLTPEDLVQIKTEIAALRAEIQAQDRTPSSPLLTRQEAARYLRISKRTLDTAEAEGELRAIRVRGRVLYHRDALDAYIRRCAEREGSQR
jgi:excisionase family DNA binding protein